VRNKIRATDSIGGSYSLDEGGDVPFLGFAVPFVVCPGVSTGLEYGVLGQAVGGALSSLGGGQ